MALLAIVALAGPRGGRAEITTRSHALSIVMAVDISRSMLAEDARPNRLQRAVREARRLVQDSPAIGPASSPLPAAATSWRR